MPFWKNAQTYITILAAMVAAATSYFGVLADLRAIDRRTVILESHKADQTRWITDQNTAAITSLREEAAKTRADVGELKAGIGIANTKLDNLVELVKRDREKHP